LLPCISMCGWEDASPQMQKRREKKEGREKSPFVAFRVKIYVPPRPPPPPPNGQGGKRGKEKKLIVCVRDKDGFRCTKSNFGAEEGGKKKLTRRHRSCKFLLSFHLGRAAKAEERRGGGRRNR